MDWIYAWKALPCKDGKLSPQTFTSLKHSCLALPKIVNHLTKECGFTYFLSYFLQTDALEHHFGVYRMMSGANYHISYCQVLESERRLKVSTILNIFSNQQSNLTLAEFIKSFSAPPDETDNDTSVDISLYFPAISNLSDIYIDTHTLQSLSFIGGYTVHQLCKHLSPCRDCMDFLTVDKFLYPEDSDSKYKIFEFIDRGNLKWPSDVVLDAVIITWKIFIIIEQNDELLNRFIAGSSRNTLVHLSFSTIEYQESEHWRNTCLKCNTLGWVYLKRILTVTSNCIISNKVKNFNSIVSFRSKEKISSRKIRKLNPQSTPESDILSVKKYKSAN